ncbi:MAG: SPFH domain-containing protein [Alphaproteobacteria bacterium]
MDFSGFIGTIVVLILIIFLIISGVKTVPQGFEYTVERFGRYRRTLKPGLSLIVPFLDAIGQRVNMRESVMDIPTQEVITRDNAIVVVDGVVFYQIGDAAKAAYQVNDLERAMENLALTNIRTVMGSMELDELLSQRDRINAELLTVIDQATNPWGTKVTRVEIRDIAPPADLQASMSRQMKAERDKRAQVLEASGSREADILRAEGEKQAAILKAEGELEAARRQAEARERLAEADAVATRMVSEAIANGDIQAVNYFVATKYTEALQGIASASNSKVVLMPMEASNVIGSIAGIAEIAKQTFSEKDEPKEGTKPTRKTSRSLPKA